MRGQVHMEDAREGDDGLSASGPCAHQELGRGALLVVAAAVVVLAAFGSVLAQSGGCCPEVGSYSLCTVRQDIRAVLSFVLGALLCCLVTHGKDDHEDEQRGWVDKVKLYSAVL
mmetsp:Transcript_99971/g.260649  ORF Transcript_99971/g.260649 Transcript_99971/m.260649 type:complete len:114 (-) Transcript_99971:241-582(-)